MLRTVKSESDCSLTHSHVTEELNQKIITCKDSVLIAQFTHSIGL